MAPSSRDRISVDLRGLKAALVERSRAQGQTPSDFVRALLAVALHAEADEVRPAPEPGLPGPRVRLSLRMSRDEARLVIERARAAGLPIGAYVAGLCAGIPAIVGGARPADQIATLVRSSAELATLARDLRHLTLLLRQGEVRAAQEYRRLFDTLGDDVRAHLRLAARTLADLRPARQLQQGDSHARTP